MQNDVEEVFCRICYSYLNPVTNKCDLITPCDCSGSIKHVHHSCLKMWRMKGKAFGDIKRCEQCKSEYKIPGERNVYGFFISLTAFLFIFIAYLLTSLIFQHVCYATVTIYDEMFSTWSSDLFIVYHGNLRELYISWCLIFFSLYHIYNEPSTVLIFTYLASYFGIMLYNSVLAGIVFVSITVCILKEMYLEMYSMFDGFYFYVMNLNWESSQNKILN